MLRDNIVMLEGRCLKVLISRFFICLIKIKSLASVVSLDELIEIIRDLHYYIGVASLPHCGLRYVLNI